MTRTLLRFLLPLVLCLVFTRSISGSETSPSSDYTLREWHGSDGLPSEEIGTIFQDAEGYLVIATLEKVLRFDGAVFENIPLPAETVISTLQLRSLKSLAGGRWLVPAAQPADCVYLIGNDSQIRQELPELTGHLVKTAFVEKDGVVWIGRGDGAVLRHAAGKTTVFPLTEKLGGRVYASFATNGAGEIWVAMGSELLRFRDGQLQPVSSEPVGYELQVVSSHTGQPWVITPDAVLRMIGGRLEKIASLPKLIGAHFVQAGLEDRAGNLWIGTRSQGLFCLSQGEVNAVATSHEDIHSLFEDRDGNLWAGTNGGGLNRLRPKSYQLYNRTAGLGDNYSYTVAEDAEGDVWLGNRDGGVVRIRKGKPDQLSRRAGWPEFSALSVYPDSHGGIFTTSGMGVFRAERARPENIRRLEELSPFGIFRVSLVTAKGDYWLAGESGRAVRWRDGQIRVFTKADGLDVREIRVFAEHTDGTLWIGASEGRLFRATDDGFEHIIFPGSDACGTIQAIYWDTNGRPILGTTHAGMIALDLEAPGKARRLGLDQGLPSENICAIMNDDAGGCWVASRSGVFSISLRELQDFVEGRVSRVHATLLGKDEGIKDISCLGMFKPSAWRTRDGHLWFATRSGMLRIDPAKSTSVREPPPVVITAVRCDDAPHTLEPAISLPATFRKLEIRYSALSLSEPERILIEHRLDGLDSDWIAQDRNRSAVYPRLPPGRYTFRARTSNGSGIWNETGRPLAIIVPPAWWQTTWGIAGGVLTLIVIVAASVRIVSQRRFRRKLDKLRRETAIERERTRIAQNIHDDLGASLTQISLLTQCAEGETPAQNASLDKIFETAEEITRSLDEIVWAVNPKYDDLDSLVYYLGNFTQNFLDVAGIRCRLELPREGRPLSLSSQTRHNLFLCCKEALNNVVKHARAREVTLALKADHESIVVEISDDGVGLPATPPADSGSQQPRIIRGNGLQNIARRISEMGGTFEIQNRPSGGTRVRYSIPTHSTVEDL